MFVGLFGLLLLLLHLYLHRLCLRLLRLRRWWRRLQQQRLLLPPCFGNFLEVTLAAGFLLAGGCSLSLIHI